MSRNHERLRVYHDAHSLTLAIYRNSEAFPRDEWFGLRSQIRRAAASVGCNIVEGSARDTTRDYVRFLTLALGSSCELQYLILLVRELELNSRANWADLEEQSKHVSRQLRRLIDRLPGDGESLPGRRSESGPG
jgi:four helix bundle protein